MTDKNKSIYDLKLHETLEISGEFIKVIKVVGGWLYIYWNTEPNHIAFVPYHEEFKDKK